jgi:hypothetical protein
MQQGLFLHIFNAFWLFARIEVPFLCSLHNPIKKIYFQNFHEKLQESGGMLL